MCTLCKRLNQEIEILDLNCMIIIFKTRKKVIKEYNAI